MRDRFVQMLVPAILVLALVVAVRHLHAQAKPPVPAAESQEAARKAANEFYGGRFQQAKTAAERTALATEMIEAAAKVQDASPDQCVLLKIAADIAVGGWAGSSITLYRNNGRFRFMLPGGLSRGDCIAPTGTQARSWHHLVCVWTGAEMGLYVNGQLAARVPGEGPALSADAVARHPARLGTLASGQDKQLYFRGILDEVAVFRRALSEQEIQWLLQVGVQGEPLVKATRTRSGH